MRNPFRRKPKKEWVGEAGYCNCLLVVMARMQIASIEINTKESLPNFEELTATRPDSREWIEAQEFQYDKLDRLTIVRMLAEMAGISPQTGRRSGTIQVQDVGDDDKVIQRVFSMELSILGEDPILTVSQQGIN
jgi:hypothetical protein